MARTTKLRSGAVIEDTIEDKDGDTKVTVEESSDEDKIRFDTAGSQRMIIDEVGQVGVGTDAPEEQFHIHGANATLRLGNGVNSGEHSPKIQLSEMADSSGDMSYGYSIGYNGATNNFEIKRHSNSVSGNEVLIANRSTGDIGIKTASPEADLHVYGGSSGETFSNVTFAVENNGSSDSFYAFQTATVGGGKSFSITNGGKVGIGTTVPSSELTINGAQPAITLRESDADRAEIGINDSDNLVITNQSTNKYIVFKTNDAGTVREGFRIGGVTPEVVVNEGSDSLIDFRVESNNNAYMLFVDGGNEKVGIGLGLPQTTLHVHADSIENGTVTISQSDDSGDASQLDIVKSRGSGAQPADVQSGDFIGQVRFLGYEGSSYQNFADIYAQAAGTIDAANHPTKVVIRTTPLGGTTPVSAVTIDENQNLTAAGGVYGKMRHMTHHRYNDGSGTGKEYIPWVGTSEQPSPSYITQGVAPYNGRLAAVWVRSSKSGGLGNTSVAIHIGVNGDTVVNSTAEETITVDMSQQNTSYAFDFTASTHFAAGDVIGVAIDPTNQHGNVNVTCIWEYTITA